MNNSITLNEIQIEEIYKLAGEQRRTLGFVGDPAIANDIFTILDNMNILLLEYPIESDNEKPAFSAALMYSTECDKEFIFIGLNTADFFDKQIFAIAHELYHYFIKTGSHLSRLSEEQNDLIEVKANLFAAEFLLPVSTLASIVLNEFKTSKLQLIQKKTLLRFIARMQCTWWLPYRSLVRRLREIKAISNEQYNQLYEIDERDMDGEYARIGKAINREVFIKLNTATNNIGTSPKNIEIVIRNFEDNIIDEDQFNDTLSLFDKRADDFGYEIEVAPEDIDEFEEFFNEEAKHEN
ncbi:ImmA/IrrE family metallo-endopeptidase [Clostridium sp. CS001]|uniref:ImmA/IrrE family metallo-endopeptidase n=1 Tax=Clostridium sp. CS001 TaxID=2880648 RepID=UPI001CF45219|nr:ImmA/IrrE family metallo-endopeptidase [Clostridium sp. CS001]MCB2291855.1 ImmA/IrrE family metallo-endopeptidase [Clostridium sp. CS001]